MRAALFAAAAAALQHGAAPLRAPLAPLRVTQGEAPIASPFENNAPAAGAAASVEFSMANVDAVLDDVRPYLIQDGGEVTVLEADPATKNVVLRLEGACGSCPSSTTTMKMGIERVLKERWPDIGSVTRDTDPENQTLDVAAGAGNQTAGCLQGAVSSCAAWSGRAPESISAKFWRISSPD